MIRLPFRMNFTLVNIHLVILLYLKFTCATILFVGSSLLCECFQIKRGPAGWDNENKIAYLNDHLRTIQGDKSYNAVITRPTFMKPKVDPEPNCDDDQLFLIDVETCIEKYEKTPHRATTAPSTHSQPNLSKSIASSRTPSKGPPDANATREPGDTMISQFFNALLHKKGTSPNSPNNVSQNSSTTSPPNISQTQS